MHTGARAHACTPCHTCTHTFRARTSPSTAHTCTQRTPPLTRACCTRARVRTHALPRHARPGLGPFGRDRRGASALNLQAPSAQQPAPGLEPETHELRAALTEHARSRAEPTPGMRGPRPERPALPTPTVPSAGPCPEVRGADLRSSSSDSLQTTAISAGSAESLAHSPRGVSLRK